MHTYMYILKPRLYIFRFSDSRLKASRSIWACIVALVAYSSRSTALVQNIERILEQLTKPSFQCIYICNIISCYTACPIFPHKYKLRTSTGESTYSSLYSEDPKVSRVKKKKGTFSHMSVHFYGQWTKRNLSIISNRRSTSFSSKRHIYFGR